MNVEKKPIETKDFFEAITKIKLRTEKQSDDTEHLSNFVRLVGFEELASSNTQIIYGRNGTGKTHLLQAFNEYSQFHFEETRILPVYIDLKNLDLGPILPSIEIDDLVVRFYRRFITEVISELESFADDVITVSMLESIFRRGNQISRKNKINEHIEALNALLNLEQIEELVSSYARTVERDKERGSTIEGKAALSTKLSVMGPDAALSTEIGLSAEDIEREKEKVELIYRGLAVIDFDKIKKHLESIIKLCGAKAIILLVDEWSTINLNLQPYFAEMIRKTLAISDKIFLKIVASRYFTQTSALVEPPQRIGFQQGIDISILTDLDMLLNYDADPQNVKDFLVLVAHKHASNELPALKQYSPVEFESLLCDKVLDGPEALLEVARASEGNPRDFLAILMQCCTQAKLKEEKIPLKQVINIAGRHFIYSKAPELKNNPPVETLYNKIFERVVKSKNKLFLFSTNKAEKDERVQELWHYRSIHVRNPSFMVINEEGFPNEYTVYSMDYGKLISLKAAQKGEQAINKMLEILETINRLHIIPNVLNVSIEACLSYSSNDWIKGALIPVIGPRLVDEVENANIEDVESLIEKSILDELLYGWKKPA